MNSNGKIKREDSQIAVSHTLFTSLYNNLVAHDCVHHHPSEWTRIAVPSSSFSFLKGNRISKSNLNVEVQNFTIRFLLFLDCVRNLRKLPEISLGNVLGLIGLDKGKQFFQF